MTLNRMVMSIQSENVDKVSVDRDDAIKVTKIKVDKILRCLLLMTSKYSRSSSLIKTKTQVLIQQRMLALACGLVSLLQETS